MALGGRGAARGATRLVNVGTPDYLYANRPTSGPTLKYNGIGEVAGERIRCASPPCYLSKIED